jgi:lysozyme
MKTGARGLALIKRFEGLRIQAYRDSVGVWTIGYGHTAAAGPPKPHAGLRIARAQADEILSRDLGKYEAGVMRAITREPSQNQFDAMVSLCFNVGPGAFARSTLVKRFNSGNIEGAGEAFLAFRKAKGKVWVGLERRREAERRLFLAGRTTGTKWAIAGAGGSMGGGIAATFAESAASSLGYSLPGLLSWQMLLIAAVVTGALAVVALVAMGEDRRELLWERVVG